MSSIFFYDTVYDLDRVLEEAFKSYQPEKNVQRSRKSTFLKPRYVFICCFIYIAADILLLLRMDLREDASKNLVTATIELPGALKEDVQISVQDSKLTVSTELKQSTEHEAKGYVVRERHFGRFSRTLQLP